MREIAVLEAPRPDRNRPKATSWAEAPASSKPLILTEEEHILVVAKGARASKDEGNNMCLAQSAARQPWEGRESIK